MNAVITVTTLHTADGDTQKIEMMTEGTYERTSYGYHIQYGETEENGYKDSNIELLIFDSGKLQIIRSGAVSSELLIELGTKHYCTYGTPYGDMMVGVQAREIKSTLNKNGGEAFASYVVDFNSCLVGEYEMTITVKTEN